jgi:arylformamidase
MSESDDRRVQFDFEIDFAHGGGIQGQGFRLDIGGDDISDRELADYIVRDLRLLMVGETRILNKQIIKERHKRRANAAQPSEATDHSVFVDLSHTIEDGMITYKGLPAPVICDFLATRTAAPSTRRGPSSRSARSTCARTPAPTSIVRITATPTDPTSHN